MRTIFPTIHIEGEEKGMKDTITFSTPEKSRKVSIPLHMDSLMAELDVCRRKAERLSLINELHTRLAGVNDLPGIIEAFSVWLMPQAGHDLIAYNNASRERTHMFCSCHGPQRQDVMSVAKKLFEKISDKEPADSVRMDGYYLKYWKTGLIQDRGVLLLLRKENDFTPDECRIIEEGLEILHGPLRRALAYEDLFEQASRDSLTGLANRRVFEERIGPLLDRAIRHDRSISLASMDLDRFKQINDTFGHVEGDLVLQKVAEAMQDSVRSTDLLVRMGGDEFLLVLPDTDLQSAQNLAERVCANVDEMNIRSNETDRLGVSIGLVQWQRGMTKDDWIQRADEVLYHAKSTGRSKVCVA